MTMDLEAFRKDTRAWLAENCPESMRQGTIHFEDAFEVYNTDDARVWLDRAAERGWTAPMWPKEYGGGGLSKEEGAILRQEMAAISALPRASICLSPPLREPANCFFRSLRMGKRPKISSKAFLNSSDVHCFGVGVLNKPYLSFALYIKEPSQIRSI